MSHQPACRACGSPLRQTFVDLGKTPLANSYLEPAQLKLPEPSFPLHARVCGGCRLVQVDDVATPDEIFSHYAYFSSYSAQWVEHARRFAEMSAQRWGLGSNSKVIEVASNDGYLLQHFVKMAIPVLGVEPAANVAKVAVERGVATEVAFFGLETAKRLVARGDAADLVAGNNVFAHVPDINDFTAGLAAILKPEGVISLEFPHLLQLIENVQFDTIYHEHFSYLSLYATEKLMTRHGLRVFDVTELPTHGGSLRVMACKVDALSHPEQPGVAKIRADEARASFDKDEGYAGFEPRVRKVQNDLLAFLRKAKADGHKVAAYGAAAKGNTLLNTAGVTADLIEYVVDLNPHKQGHHLPGSHLPVYPPDRIRETRPAYVLILPWNLKDEIGAQLKDITSWGGRFVVAVPELRVFEPRS